MQSHTEQNPRADPGNVQSSVCWRGVVGYGARLRSAGPDIRTMHPVLQLHGLVYSTCSLFPAGWLGLDGVHCSIMQNLQHFPPGDLLSWKLLYLQPKLASKTLKLVRWTPQGKQPHIPPDTTHHRYDNRTTSTHQVILLQSGEGSQCLHWWLCCQPGLWMLQVWGLLFLDINFGTTVFDSVGSP